MSKVTFRTLSGSEKVVPIIEDTTVMRLALANSMPGIIGRCGGYATCGTCHVWVGPESAQHIPIPAPSEELDVLAGVDTQVTQASRLGCQISLSPDSPSLTFVIP
jgi:2Fe-2S ferredoxin